MQTTLSDYEGQYERLRFERSDGILQITLHSDGDSLRWSGAAHHEVSAALADVAADRQNLVVIVTGVGAEFVGPRGSAATVPGSTAEGWDVAQGDATRILTNLLAIPVPMITALNGSVFRHPELPLASDIVLASSEAVIQDSSHFIVGLVPADGGHLLLPLIMGATRARYFLLTGQELTADQAKEFGLVNEVLPPDDVLPRAWAIAREMVKQRPLVLRNTRAAFAHSMRQLIAAGQPLGLMLEGMASIDAAQQPGFEGYVIGGPTTS